MDDTPLDSWRLALEALELTPAQRAAAIARRKQIWEALHPTGGNSFSTGRNPDGRFGEGQQQFAADTAKAAGMTKRSINEHLSRASALGADLHKNNSCTAFDLILYSIS